MDIQSLDRLIASFWEVFTSEGMVFVELNSEYDLMHRATFKQCCENASRSKNPQVAISTRRILAIEDVRKNKEALRALLNRLPNYISFS